MGRASRIKKIRNNILKGVTTNGANEIMPKLDRELRRDMGMARANDGTLYKIPQFKEVPCQMDSRYKALIPESTTPHENDKGQLCMYKDDKEVVITSWNHAENVRIAELRKQLQEDRQKLKDIGAMKPTPLGE